MSFQLTWSGRRHSVDVVARGEADAARGLIQLLGGAAPQIDQHRHEVDELPDRVEERALAVAAAVVQDLDRDLLRLQQPAQQPVDDQVRELERALTW
jgi:hypothetical protein